MEFSFQDYQTTLLVVDIAEVEGEFVAALENREHQVERPAQVAGGFAIFGAEFILTGAAVSKGSGTMSTPEGDPRNGATRSNG